MTDEPPHVRSFADKMKRYFGNIESELYKAEVACEGVLDFNACKNEPCAFSDEENGCKLLAIRFIIGDHIEQHNISVADIDSHAVDVMR